MNNRPSRRQTLVAGISLVAATALGLTACGSSSGGSSAGGSGDNPPRAIHKLDANLDRRISPGIQHFAGLDARYPG